MKSDDRARSGRAARRRSHDPPIVVGGVAPVHGLEHRISARLHREMQERHQLVDAAVRLDQVGGHVAGMRGGVTDAREVVDFGQRPDQSGQAPRPLVGSVAAVSVDVLTEQDDLARAGVDQAARFGEDRRCGARRFRASGVRHHAERAELVAALLDGKERGDAGRACQLLGQTIELALDREVGIEHAALRARPPVQQLGQAVIGLRPDHDVDERRSLEQGLALSLRHAAGDPDHHVGAVRPSARAQLAQPTQLRIDLLGRLFPDVAGVEDDQICIVGAAGGDIAMQRQGIRHAGGVIDVHLAAVGLDKQFLGHASMATSHEFEGRRDQIDARIATCHACRLTLPHDTFMGIRRQRVKRLRCTGRARSSIRRSPSGRMQPARSNARSVARRASVLLHGRVSATPLVQVTRRASAGLACQLVDRAHPPSGRVPAVGAAPVRAMRLSRRRPGRHAAPRLVRAPRLVPSPIFLASALRCWA